MKLRVTTLLLLAAVAFACKEKPKAKTSHAAAVVFVVGSDAKVITPAGEKAAAKGIVLQESDKIVTGPKSQVDLLLPNNILIRIDKNSTVLMQEFTAAENGVQHDRLMLEKGTVFSKVARLDKRSTFAIHTPTLVAGVRGTEFMTEADANGTGKVAVIEGKVGVESKSGSSEEVTAGNQANVSASGDTSVGKVDASTQSKLITLSSIADIKAADLQKFQDVLANQQKILDAASGEKAVQEMMQKKDANIQEQKDKAKQLIDDNKAKTDKNIQDMKSLTDEKVKKSSEGVDNQKEATQKKLDSMKDNSVDAAKKKQEDLFKKFNK